MSVVVVNGNPVVSHSSGTALDYVPPVESMIRFYHSIHSVRSPRFGSLIRIFDFRFPFSLSALLNIPFYTDTHDDFIEVLANQTDTQTLISFKRGLIISASVCFTITVIIVVIYPNNPLPIRVGRC